MILPVKFIKKLISLFKSLNWTKDDLKKIVIFVLMLLIGCFIVNKFLFIKVTIFQDRYERLDVNADISGSFPDVLLPHR